MGIDPAQPVVPDGHMPTPLYACSEGAAVSDLGELLAWMPAMQQQAAGHVEGALDSYTALLDRVEGGTARMRDETIAFVVAQASKAYSAVADWEGMEAFFARLEVITGTPSLWVLFSTEVVGTLWISVTVGTLHMSSPCSLSSASGQQANTEKWPRILSLLPLHYLRFLQALQMYRVTT